MAEFEFDYGKESKDIKFARRLEDPTLSFPVGCSFSDLSGNLGKQGIFHNVRTTLAYRRGRLKSLCKCCAIFSVCQSYSKRKVRRHSKQGRLGASDQKFGKR